MKRWMFTMVCLFAMGTVYAQVQGNWQSKISRLIISSYHKQQILEAVKSNKKSAVEAVLNKSITPKALVNVKDEKGNTPLMIAVQNDNWDIIKLLGKNGAYVNTTNDDNWTALCFAAQHQNPKVIDDLLAKNAHADYKCGKDDKVVTPLYLASWNGAIPKIIQALVDKKADVNFSYWKDSTTPLMGAAESGHTKSVEILLNAGANINAKTTGMDYGVTATWFAIFNNDLPTLQFLMENGGTPDAFLSDDAIMDVQDWVTHYYFCTYAMSRGISLEMAKYLKLKGYLNLEL